VLRRSGLSGAPRFLWECLTSPTVSPSPAPATSNGAGGFPALRSPAHFTPRLMRLPAAAALWAATCVPAYSTWPAQVGLPLGVYPPSQVLQMTGAFLRAPLPPLLTEALRTAGPLRSAGITPPRRYYGPIRHPLVVGRLPGVAGYTAYPASAVSGRDEEGFSSCWVCPCRRAVANHPAGATHRINRSAMCRAAFALTVAGSAPGSIPFEATTRSLALRPGDSHPPQGWGRQGASGQSVSLLPALQLRGFRFLPRRD
jgi:hypothetical protein